MSENQNFGFGKFVPGFDFLQGLAKGTSPGLPQMPSLSSWVAPTMNVEELEKRIGELKAVHFWLDQNSKALGATIQALEVQKMTLATLRGMNFNMTDLANSMRLKAADTLQKASERAAPAPAEAPAPSPVAQAEPEPESEPAAAKSSRRGKARAGSVAPAGGVVDPLQWWGALTQQFQQIASDAMKDAAAHGAMDAARNMAGGMAKEAVKAATGMAAGAVKSAAKRKAAPAKTPARKTAARKKA